MYSTKVHIVVASDIEYDMILDVMKNLQLKAALYKLQLKDVKLHKTGIGPIDTMKYLIRNQRSFRTGDIILNVGLAGYNGTPESRIYQIRYSKNLDEDLRPVGGDNCYHTCTLPTFSIPTQSAACYSSASFVTKDLAKFRNLPEHSVCDMELHTICQFLENFNIYSVKYISDTLDGGVYNDDAEQCLKDLGNWLIVNLPHILTDIVSRN